MPSLGQSFLTNRKNHLVGSLRLVHWKITHQILRRKQNGCSKWVGVVNFFNKGAFPRRDCRSFFLLYSDHVLLLAKLTDHLFPLSFQNHAVTYDKMFSILSQAAWMGQKQKEWVLHFVWQRKIFHSFCLALTGNLFSCRLYRVSSFSISHYTWELRYASLSLFQESDRFDTQNVCCSMEMGRAVWKHDANLSGQPTTYRQRNDCLSYLSTTLLLSEFF